MAQLQLVQQKLFLDVLQLSSAVQQRVDGKNEGITWRFVEFGEVSLFNLLENLPEKWLKEFISDAKRCCTFIRPTSAPSGKSSGNREKG